MKFTEEQKQLIQLMTHCMIHQYYGDTDVEEMYELKDVINYGTDKEMIDLIFNKSYLEFRDHYGLDKLIVFTDSEQRMIDLMSHCMLFKYTTSTAKVITHELVDIIDDGSDRIEEMYEQAYHDFKYEATVNELIDCTEFARQAGLFVDYMAIQYERDAKRDFIYKDMQLVFADCELYDHIDFESAFDEAYVLWTAPTYF